MCCDMYFNYKMWNISYFTKKANTDLREQLFHYSINKHITLSILLLSVLLTCFQSEYSWHTVRWTSNNNQSINLMIGLLNRPRFIMFVIISRTLTRPACHCFALQGLGHVPTKNPPWLLKQSFCFTFQMRGYNIFFNNRYEHLQ